MKCCDSVIHMYSFFHFLFHCDLSEDIIPCAILWDPVLYPSYI